MSAIVRAVKNGAQHHGCSVILIGAGTDFVSFKHLPASSSSISTYVRLGLIRRSFRCRLRGLKFTIALLVRSLLARGFLLSGCPFPLSLSPPVPPRCCFHALVGASLSSACFRIEVGTSLWCRAHCLSCTYLYPSGRAAVGKKLGLLVPKVPLKVLIQQEDESLIM